MVLGTARPAAAIVVLLPGLVLLKEGAYAGAAFMLGMAVYAARDGVRGWSFPLALLAPLIVSHVTLPASRRLVPSRTAA